MASPTTSTSPSTANLTSTPGSGCASLPPRKRARTEAEKEQRKIERIIRNRKAAHASREKKRKHVEHLEAYVKLLESNVNNLYQNQEVLISLLKGESIIRVEKVERPADLCLSDEQQEDAIVEQEQEHEQEQEDTFSSPKKARTTRRSAQTAEPVTEQIPIRSPITKSSISNASTPTALLADDEIESVPYLTSDSSSTSSSPHLPSSPASPFQDLNVNSLDSMEYVLNNSEAIVNLDLTVANGIKMEDEFDIFSEPSTTVNTMDLTPYFEQDFQFIPATNTLATTINENSDKSLGFLDVFNRVHSAVMHRYSFLI
jgi:transcriptional activator HAC1